MMDVPAYLGLFFAAFLAATFFPFQSEAVLVGMLAGGYSSFWTVLVASLGNILGAVVNWLLGLFIDHFSHRRWFPIDEKKRAAAQRWYQKWGHWSLLLSWAPFVGDPLTLAAGMMREPLWRFLLLVSIAKTGRYIILAWLTSHAVQSF